MVRRLFLMLRQVKMSLQSCFSRSAETCDPPCVLEYRADAEGGLPTCVPPSSSLHQLALSDDDVTAMKQILERLLPEAASLDFRQIIETVTGDLGEHINRKIKNAVTMSRFGSWRDAAHRISREVIMEIEATDCLICTESLRDLNSNKTLHTTQCTSATGVCANIIHLSCYTEWVRRKGECIFCREPVIMNEGVPVQTTREAQRRFLLDDVAVEPIDQRRAERIARYAENIARLDEDIARLDARILDEFDRAFDSIFYIIVIIACYLVGRECDLW